MPYHHARYPIRIIIDIQPIAVSYPGERQFPAGGTTVSCRGNDSFLQGERQFPAMETVKQLGVLSYELFRLIILFARHLFIISLRVTSITFKVGQNFGSGSIYFLVQHVNPVRQAQLFARL